MGDLGTLMIILLVAVAYLIYKVHRLEMLLEGRSRPRRLTRVGPDGRPVIPVLKEHIEPGPFKTGNERASQNPPPSDQEE